MTAELALLRDVYGAVEYVEAGGEDWFKLLSYPVPEGWLVGGELRAAVPIVFLIKANYPGATPYGFLTPAGMTFKSRVPNRTGGPPKKVPFPGDWMHFSWQCDDWQACNDPKEGSNLLTWARSFAHRLHEGV